MSARDATGAIGFGGRPGRQPTRLKPEPQSRTAVGESPERFDWEDLWRQWQDSTP